MSEEFIEWLLALILTLTGALADIGTPEVSPEPTTSTTMSVEAPEPAPQLTGGEEVELQVAGISMTQFSADWETAYQESLNHWLANCGNGIYDTKFAACPDAYNRTHGWIGLVQKHWWDTGNGSEDVAIALCVIYGESRGKPDITNSIGARGLFQIMPNWANNAWLGSDGISYADFYDPETNIMVARMVWDKQGWGAWSAYGRGYVQDCINMNAYNGWADETGQYHAGD